MTVNIEIPLNEHSVAEKPDEYHLVSLLEKVGDISTVDNDIVFHFIKKRSNTQLQLKQISRPSLTIIFINIPFCLIIW